MKMPLCEFYELHFFESFIEPQGPVIDDFYQARLIHTINANNANMTKDGLKKLNIRDNYILKDKVFLSPEELEKERIKAEEARVKKIESLMDPKLLAKAKQMKNRKK